MTKPPDTIRVIVREKPYPNPYSVYCIEIGSHDLEVEQKCIDRLHDLTQGQWDVEFDGGQIVLYGQFERGGPPTTCIRCGKRLPVSWRDYCDDCLRTVLEGRLPA
jgi:hypothetical protein